MSMQMYGQWSILLGLLLFIVDVPLSIYMHHGCLFAANACVQLGSVLLIRFVVSNHFHSTGLDCAGHLSNETITTYCLVENYCHTDKCLTPRENGWYTVQLFQMSLAIIQIQDY